MIKLKDIEYRGFLMEIFVDDRGKFQASVKGIGSGFFKGDINGFHSSLESAVDATRKDVDTFISQTPKDWDELAEALTESLVWTGYEDCYVNPQILETLVKNYWDYRNSVQRVTGVEAV